MKRKTFVLIAPLLALNLFSQDEPKGVFPDDSPFSDKKPDMTEDEKARLEKDKVLISRLEVKQCFTAYMDGKYPRFVTSDAVLNAYHVLFEETLRQLEEQQARHLHSLCGGLWKLLATADRMYEGDAAQIAAAKMRARFIIGVAAGLLGRKIDDGEADLKRAIQAEVAAVEEAEGNRKPALLGKPEPDFLALDYLLFRPAGFYQNSIRLQRYFRALRWLQVVPFRMDRGEELLAYHMLEMALQPPWKWGGGMKDTKHLPVGLDNVTHEELTQALWKRKRFASSFGLKWSEWDLCETAISRGDEAPLKVDAAFFGERQKLVGEAGKATRVASNDRVRTTNPDPSLHELRVLSGFRLPEDDAMTVLTRDGQPDRSPGLEFAAWLGLPKAEEMSGQALVTRLASLRPEIETYSDDKLKSLPWWQRVSHGYGEMSLTYRAALRLLAEVDPRAPAFMHGEAWKAKTMQTVASSWAQERHAWALQSKPEVHVASAAPNAKGFVEPVPEFFRLLTSVAATMGELAFDAEVNSDPVMPAVEDLRAQSRWMQEQVSGKPSKEQVFTAAWIGNQTLADFRGYAEQVESEKATPDDVKRLSKKMTALADEFEREARPGTASWERIQAKRIHTTRLWHRLEILCMRLAALAEKQLQKVPLSEEDGRLVEGVGDELSEIMLYRGQAKIFPADDAPRIARIATDPQSGEVLHVGIGRPRLMFVLYPWEGKEILCRGVVMPFHEVRDAKTLTDDEWRKRQDGTSRAAVPKWLHGHVPTEEIVVQSRH